MYDYYDYGFDMYDDPFATGLYNLNSNPFSSYASIILSLLVALAFFAMFVCVISIIVLVAKWKLFKKGGRKPWESLIPIHSEIVELEMGGIETYWFFLNFAVVFPFLGCIPVIFLRFWKCIELSKAFGKSVGFGVLTAFLPFIGYPILAFGNSQYIGPQTNTNSQNFYGTNYNSSNAYNNNFQGYANNSNTVSYGVNQGESNVETDTQSTNLEQNNLASEPSAGDVISEPTENNNNNVNSASTSSDDIDSNQTNLFDM